MGTGLSAALDHRHDTLGRMWSTRRWQGKQALPNIHAGAAESHVQVISYRHTGTMACGNARGAHTAAAGPDHEQVVVAATAGTARRRGQPAAPERPAEAAVKECHCCRSNGRFLILVYFDQRLWLVASLLTLCTSDRVAPLEYVCGGILGRGRVLSISTDWPARWSLSIWGRGTPANG